MIRRYASCQTATHTHQPVDFSRFSEPFVHKIKRLAGEKFMSVIIDGGNFERCGQRGGSLACAVIDGAALSSGQFASARQPTARPETPSQNGEA